MINEKIKDTIKCTIKKLDLSIPLVLMSVVLCFLKFYGYIKISWIVSLTPILFIPVLVTILIAIAFVSFVIMWIINRDNITITRKDKER